MPQAAYNSAYNAHDSRRLLRTNIVQIADTAKTFKPIDPKPGLFSLRLSRCRWR